MREQIKNMVRKFGRLQFRVLGADGKLRAKCPVCRGNTRTIHYGLPPESEAYIRCSAGCSVEAILGKLNVTAEEWEGLQRTEGAKGGKGEGASGGASGLTGDRAGGTPAAPEQRQQNEEEKRGTGEGERRLGQELDGGAMAGPRRTQGQDAHATNGAAGRRRAQERQETEGENGGKGEGAELLTHGQDAHATNGDAGGAGDETTEEVFAELLEQESLTRDPDAVDSLWRRVSGFSSEKVERELPAGFRLRGIRKLIQSVERLVRAELRRCENDPEFNAERTYLWDPLRTICFYLGIARTKLSSYSKELTGLAAQEIVDRVRAEGVKKKLRLELRPWVTPRWQHEKCTCHKKELLWFCPYHNNMAETCWIIHRDVKRERQKQGFQNSSWAMEHGFASFSRFSRACMLAYRKTPLQLELEIMAELVRELRERHREKCEGRSANVEVTATETAEGANGGRGEGETVARNDNNVLLSE